MVKSKVSYGLDAKLGNEVVADHIGEFFVELSVKVYFLRLNGNEILVKERQWYEPAAERYIADFTESEIRQACEQGNKSCHITMPEDRKLRKYVKKCLEENGFSINSCGSFWFASWNIEEE